MQSMNDFPRISELYWDDRAWVQARFPQSDDEDKLSWQIRCKRTWEDLKELQKVEDEERLKAQMLNPDGTVIGLEDFTETPLTERSHNTRRKYYLKAVEGILTEMAETPEGFRNETLNTLGFRLGNLTAGLGFEQYGERMWQALRDAAVETGLSHREAAYHAKRAYNQGLPNPWRPQ